MTTQKFANALDGYTIVYLASGQVIDVTRESGCRIIPCYLALCKKSNDELEDVEPECTEEDMELRDEVLEGIEPKDAEGCCSGCRLLIEGAMVDDLVAFPLLPDGIKIMADELMEDCKNHTVRFDDTGFYKDAYYVNCPAKDFLEELPDFNFRESMNHIQAMILKTLDKIDCHYYEIRTNEQRFLYTTKARSDEMMILDFDDNAYRPAARLISYSHTGVGYLDVEQLYADYGLVSDGAVDAMFKNVGDDYIDRLNSGIPFYGGSRKLGSWHVYDAMTLVHVVPTMIVVDGQVQRIGYDFAGTLDDFGEPMEYVNLGGFSSVYSAQTNKDGKLIVRHTLERAK